ncbi:hypothetical protein C0V73_12115 [Rhizobium sp. TH135]|uniref:DUF1127 domain-containing protein n=1 Tax=Rhizobium sp. TH135 TaxID=2067451 RepID=UPI000C7CE55F|nr:DUF1127 domain-containing protein [Rhizobium sp. TH135]PLK71329.1 hypothetical protein C0V73_12115 [Rhizobium sp. TH135]
MLSPQELTSGIFSMVTIETIGSKAVVAPVQPPRLAWLAGTIQVAGRALALWRRRTTRVHLSQLTEDQLRDVGLSPDVAEREIRKSRLLLVERSYQPPF